MIASRLRIIAKKSLNIAFAIKSDKNFDDMLKLRIIASAFESRL